MKNKADLLIKGAIAVLFVLLSVVIVKSMQEPLVETGDSAPAFTIRTDAGQTITPTSFGGRVLVLNFWATWCPPCVSEIPSLSQFQREVASSGVVVAAISVDRSEKAYRQFLKRFPVSFQTARDPEAGISASFGTFKYPETYIIKDGKVMQKIISDRNWMDPSMISYVKSL